MMKNIGRKTSGALVCASACAGVFLWSALSMAQAPKPKHINGAIELLEQGQPIYYDSPQRTGDAFAQGKHDAQTWADYITYDLETVPYDINRLTAYMQGLAAGGPTKTGHPTPAVFVVLPTRGTDEATVRANSWMIEQILATGVHGLFLPHASTAGAVRAVVEAARYPNREQGVGTRGLQEGRRGAHGAVSASKIWGITPEEYTRRAGVWPLDPNGEIMIGVKIEDKYGLANLDEIVKTPGLSFGEGGPSDMGLSLGLERGDPRGQEIQDKIFAAAKAQHLAWLMSIGPGSGPDFEARLAESIKQGHLLGATEKTAALGRKITNRQPPY
jgi:4-hydroxy-2-oxoheptanedioate aldolase